MSDEEKETKNVEEHTDEVGNTDQSNKHQHDKEEIEEKPDKKNSSQEQGMGGPIWTGGLSSEKVPELSWGERTWELLRDSYTQKNVNTPFRLDLFMKALLGKRV